MTTTPSAAAPDRKAVARFFNFKLNHDDLKQRPVPWKAIFWWTLGGLIVGYAYARGGGALALAILAGGGFAALDHWLAGLDLVRRRQAKEKSHAEFRALAQEVRLIQARDEKMAFMRIFERTSIAARDLTVLTDKYFFGKPVDFLAKESLEEQHAELQSRSIRMISQGDYKNERQRTVFWQDEKREEQFFNPTRLVALFIAAKQLVICDVQIDSMDGDLREEIQRVAAHKIVNIRFTAERKRFKPKADDLLSMAEDLGYSPEEIAEIRATLKRPPDGEEGEWVQERITSILNVTRTDGNSLTMPINDLFYFGRRRSALDHGVALTEDEKQMDRMVKELSRRVEYPDGDDEGVPKAKAAGRES